MWLYGVEVFFSGFLEYINVVCQVGDLSLDFRGLKVGDIFFKVRNLEIIFKRYSIIQFIGGQRRGLRIQWQDMLVFIINE